MDTRNITCINCPMGCRMTVEIEKEEIRSVTGNTCKRGEIYARQECTDPVRMITAVVPVVNSEIPVSVKTQSPVPKSKIFDCMNVLSGLQVTAPVAVHDVLVENICGTGVNIIATRNVS